MVNNVGIILEDCMDKKDSKFFKNIIVSAIIIYIAISLIDSIPFIYTKLLSGAKMVLSLVKPFIIGMIIAYLLYGPMTAVEKFLMNRKHFIKKKGVCRCIGMIVSYVGVIGIIVSIIIGIYCMIGGQISKSSTLSNIIRSIAGYIEENEISTEMVKNLINKYDIPFGDIIMSQMGTVVEVFQKFVLGIVGSIFEFIFNLGSNVVQIVIAVVISIYLLASHEYFKEIWDKFLFIVFRESKAGQVVREALSIVNETFSGYIRGQMIEAVIVAVLSTIVLMIVGVEDAFVIGIIAGITNIIPYIGPFIGIGLAVIVSIFQGSLFAIIGSIIGLTIVQQLDANVLSPKVVGDKVGLNPVFVIIAISVGAGLYGLLGMLIAVPIAASIKALISRWFDARMKEEYEEYKHSEEVVVEVDESQDSTVSD